METQRSKYLFWEFLEIGDEDRNNRAIHRKLTFHDQIESLGGQWIDSEYSFMEKDRILVREEIKRAEATYKAEAAQQIRDEDTLLRDFSRIIVGERGIKVEALDSFDGIADSGIARMKQLADADNQAEISTIIKSWCLDAEQIEGDDSLIDGRLLAKLLYRVNQCVRHGFIEDMELLIDLVFTQKGQIEILLGGQTDIKDFVSWVIDNKTDLQRTAFADLGKRGWNNSLPHFLEHLAKRLGLEYQSIKAKGGKITHPETGTTTYLKTYRRKKLIESYKRMKMPDIPKKVSDQEEWLFHNIRIARLNKRRLSKAEEDYFECMADRVLISRPEIISNETYQRILNSRINRELEIREA